MLKCYVNKSCCYNKEKDKLQEQPFKYREYSVFSKDTIFFYDKEGYFINDKVKIEATDNNSDYFTYMEEKVE